MLKSKLAFITGAASGIGKATCHKFVKEGARVIAADIKYDKAKQVANGIGDESCYPYKLDVTNVLEVKDVLRDVIKKHGLPPTVIVTCAGITRDNVLLQMKDDDFDNVIRVNLKGTFLVVQNTSKLMIEHNLPGSIITVSSIIGRIGNIGQTNYAASKAGVELLTKSCAMELGKYGIRCNTILPGFIETPMVETVPEKVKEKFKSRIALGRFGTPEEVSEVITFLASDKSAYVSGADWVVAGGL